MPYFPLHLENRYIYIKRPSPQRLMPFLFVYAAALESRDARSDGNGNRDGVHVVRYVSGISSSPRSDETKPWHYSAFHELRNQSESWFKGPFDDVQRMTELNEKLINAAFCYWEKTRRSPLEGSVRHIFDFESDRRARTSWQRSRPTSGKDTQTLYHISRMDTLK